MSDPISGSVAEPRKQDKPASRAGLPDPDNGNSAGDENMPSNAGKQAQSSDHWNSY